MNDKAEVDKQFDDVIKTIREKIFDSEKPDQPKGQVIFLVGAGVSMEEPSNVPDFPQKPCLQKLKYLSSYRDDIGGQLRPEFFFQILYNQLGGRGLMPLDVLNTRKLNAYGASISPNGNHYFLAKMIEIGHIVITTNFDSLIEDAYLEQTGTNLSNVAVYDKDFENLRTRRALDEGILIKLHGSFFSPTGKNTRDSIMALLHQLQRDIPHHKTELIRALLQSHDWIVMGYSARDDYDLYPLLSDREGEKRKLFWIQHETDEKGWSVVHGKDTFTSQLRDYWAKPSKEQTWQDAEERNVLSVLSSYPDNDGILIKTYTLNFVEKIWKPEKEEKTSGLDSSKNKEVGAGILETWLQSLNAVDEMKIAAELLKSLDMVEATKNALNLYREATQAEICQISGRLCLEEADAAYRIVRKSMNRQLLLDGKTKARSALEIFHGLKDIEGMADAYYVLTHLNRVENQPNEGIECGIKAINAYLTVVRSDSAKYYKLAQALRALALVVMNTTPDVPPLKDDPKKEQVESILECCSYLCSLSEEIYGNTGNITGERGLNQTLNVHGLITLRTGDYSGATKFFSKYVELSDSSRFFRESAQAYRNLGISEFSFAKAHGELNDKCGKKSRKDLCNCLICLDAVPSKISEGTPPTNKDIFNSLYNYAKALVISSNPKSAEVIPILKAYCDTGTLEKMYGDFWHWQCMVLAVLCKAESDETWAQQYAKQMFDIYNRTGLKVIKQHKFGPQNYNENVALVRERLSSKADLLLPPELPSEIEPDISLPYDALDMVKRLNAVSSQVRGVLDQRKALG